MGEENTNNLSNLAETIKKTLGDLTPKINETVKKIQEVTNTMVPNLIKECTIDGRKAKIILYNDNAVRIEFAEKDYGAEYYKNLQ